MKRLRLLKNWSHGGEDYTAGEVLEVEEGDALADDLISKSTAELSAGSIKREKVPDEGTKDTTKAVTMEDVTTVVAESLKAIAGGAKRPLVAVGKDRWMDDPAKGFKTPRHFMLEVIQAGQGKKISDQLRSLKAVGSDEQSVFDDASGGYFIPIQYSLDFFKIDPETDPMAGKTKMVPMESPTVRFNARTDKDHSTSVSGGLTVTRREEAGTIATSKMATELINLTAHSLFGFAFSTEEILTDSPVSFAALISDGFRDEFTSHIIDERINGKGVGEYLGVLNSPAKITIDKESTGTGQEAATLVYENLVKMRAQCWHYNDAIWIGNHNILPQLMQINQTVGVGGVPAWQPSAREDHPDIILGRPFITSEYANTIGTSGDLILCNWGEYLEGIFQPLQSAESMHVRFVTHERAFKFWVRNAGQPWWRSVLTPKNGSDLSPIVVLATRS